MRFGRRFDDQRQEMVLGLRSRGISDPNVLNVMGELPRHVFVTDMWLSRAYEDSALPIACDQTISQPFTVAFMTQLLAVRHGSKVLEVGTGSGYQAAVLAMLGARVFTIERHMDLMNAARKIFDHLGLTIASKTGDGSIGWSEFAPYDRIIVTAGAPDVPPSLSRQLADGGVLVVPVGTQSAQTMIRVTRKGDRFQTERFEGFKFVPLVGKEGWQKHRPGE
ncbi:MAG: protein-L-isoaspartate(D-aspartate) O-methyltransferase [Ignavibacteria bacterium]|nr:protein-L-isoaspartate(D-aspartate) O-methyltransferase [Ignavibacteria bacterium]